MAGGYLINETLYTVEEGVAWTPPPYTPNIFYDWFNLRVSGLSILAQGQVLKAGTPLESNSKGKLVAHSPMAETALVTFIDISANLTITLGGLTFTVGALPILAAELVSVWRDLPNGTTATQANVILLARGITADRGTFTAGTLTKWNTIVQNTANKVIFTSTQLLTNVVSLTASGTAPTPDIVAIAPPTVFTPIAGILVEDTDASVADQAVEIWTIASLYSSAIVWYNDPLVDTITLPNLSTKAVTPYASGAMGYDQSSSELLQAKFVEGSKFSPLGFI